MKHLIQIEVTNYYPQVLCDEVLCRGTVNSSDVFILERLEEGLEGETSSSIFNPSQTISSLWL